MPSTLHLTLSSANVAFAVGALIVSFFLFRRSRRYFQRRAAESAARGSRDRSAPNAVLHGAPIAPREVLEGQVPLHETARELLGQLDSKMSGLQALLRLADEASTRLEAAADRAERLGIGNPRDELEELEELPHRDPAAARRLIAELSDPSRQMRVDRPEHAELVLDLARHGYNSQAIAGELGLSIGDVEMLLSLYRP